MMFKSIQDYYKNPFLAGKDGLVVILVDMQHSFVEELTKEDKNIISNQILIIRQCAEKDIPVLVLEYVGIDKTIDILVEELNMVKKSITIQKVKDEGFYDTGLENLLRLMGAKSLLFMGINASCCIEETAKKAIEFNFKVKISNDVVADNLDAIAAIAKYNITPWHKWFKENGDILTTEELKQFFP